MQCKSRCPRTSRVLPAVVSVWRLLQPRAAQSRCQRTTCTPQRAVLPAPVAQVHALRQGALVVARVLHRPRSPDAVCLPVPVVAAVVAAAATGSLQRPQKSLPPGAGSGLVQGKLQPCQRRTAPVVLSLVWALLLSMWTWASVRVLQVMQQVRVRVQACCCRPPTPASRRSRPCRLPRACCCAVVQQSWAPSHCVQGLHPEGHWASLTPLLHGCTAQSSVRPSQKWKCQCRVVKKQWSKKQHHKRGQDWVY